MKVRGFGEARSLLQTGRAYATERARRHGTPDEMLSAIIEEMLKPYRPYLNSLKIDKFPFFLSHSSRLDAMQAE